LKGNRASRTQATGGMETRLMARRGVKGYAVKTKTESAKRRLAKLAKRARAKKDQRRERR